jgi:selenocysteine lyase/cysteine desulfurase
MLGIHALHASLALLLESGIESIFEQIFKKTSYLNDKLIEMQAEILSPQEISRRAGILSFRIPRWDSQQLHKQLTASGVVCALRGGGIRFSPHYYTPTQALDRAITALQRHLRGGW